jgi:hypothetical protein
MDTLRKLNADCDCAEKVDITAGKLPVGPQRAPLGSRAIARVESDGSAARCCNPDSCQGC